MMTKTQTVIKTTKRPAGDAASNDLLNARAARFNLTVTAVSGTTSSSTTPTTSADPAEAARLAARAARFADVKSAPPISTSGKVSIGGTQSNLTTTSVVDAEKLAKRAARFADIPK